MPVFVLAMMVGGWMMLDGLDRALKASKPRPKKKERIDEPEEKEPLVPEELSLDSGG